MSDRTRQIEKAWREYAKECMPKKMPKRAMDDMRRIFFNGAVEAYNLMVDLNGTEDEEGLLALQQEINEFCESQSPS